MSTERILVLAALTLVIVVSTLAIRAWNTRRIRGLLQRSDPLSALGIEPDGRPTLITFSTPSCAACHQAQAPAANTATRLLNARHIEVDAAVQPHVARAFGVLTVPSTAVLTKEGRLAAVNQGFAPTAKLVEQIRAA